MSNLTAICAVEAALLLGIHTVITLLAVAGLTHKQSYKDIFAVTMIKTAAVFVIIGVYYATGIV